MLFYIRSTTCWSLLFLCSLSAFAQKPVFDENKFHAELLALGRTAFASLSRERLDDYVIKDLEIEFGRFLGTLGQKEEAMKTFDGIINDIKKNPQYLDDLRIRDIVSACIALEYFQEAAAVIPNMQDKFVRSYSMAQLAKGYFDAGDEPKAKQWLKDAEHVKIGAKPIVSMKVTDYSEFSAEEIAVVQAELGLFDEALKTARTITYDYSQKRAFCAIAKKQGEKGLVADSEKTRQSVNNPDILAALYLDLASEQFRAKQPVEAEKSINMVLETTKKIPNDRQRLDVYLDVVNLYGGIGDKNAVAQSLAESLKFARSSPADSAGYNYPPNAPDHRSLQIAQVAATMAKHGYCEDAMNLYRNEVSGGRMMDKQYVLPWIICGIAESGNSEMALRELSQLRDPADRRRIYSNIVGTQIKKGRIQDAWQTIRLLENEAKPSAGNSSDVEDVKTVKGECLGQMALFYAKSGNRQETIAVLKQIESPSQLLKACLNVASPGTMSNGR